jgi:Domain of Unknown Function with PDB structure (DUF3857)
VHCARSRWFFSALVTMAALGFLLCARTAFARVAIASDLGAVNESEKVDIDVDRTGLAKITVERVIRIQTDEGREQASTQVVDFNERTTHFRLLKAQSLSAEKNAAPALVPAANIQIGVAPESDTEGATSFAPLKRAKISFPKVRVGTKLYLKFQLQSIHNPHRGFFNFLVDFNRWFVEKYELRIQSRLPLYQWKNDPLDQLQTSLEQVHEKSGDFYQLKAASRAPLPFVTVGEEQNQISHDRIPTLAISTLPAWRDYARSTIEKQEMLLAQKLPPSLKKIRDSAAKLESSREKINEVWAALAEEFRYFGDWRRQDGEFVPRSLAELEQTRYGDCKDLSLAVVAILRSLGFPQADLAWTARGEDGMRTMKAWPGVPVDVFDHAVVRAEDGEGRVFWIDPTEPIAQAPFVPREIQDRPSFVMNRKSPRLEMIPAQSAQGSLIQEKMRYDFSIPGTVQIEGHRELRGRAAISLTEEALSRTRDELQQEVLNGSATGTRATVSQFNGELPSSRRLNDLHFNFQYTLPEPGVRTSVGHGFVLPRESSVGALIALTDVSGRAADLLFESTGRWQREKEFVGRKLLGKENLDCEIKSSWVMARRKVTETRRAVVVNDEVEILQARISALDLTKPEFIKLRDELRNCFDRVTLIFASGRVN